MLKRVNILFVVHDTSSVLVIRNRLSNSGFEVSDNTITKITDLSELFYSYQPDLIFIDFNIAAKYMGDIKNIFSETSSKFPVIIITNREDEQTAYELTQKGAVDYIVIEDVTRLPLIVNNALERYASKLKWEKESKLITKRYDVLKSILDTVPTGIVVVDVLTNCIIEMNKFALDFLGVVKEDVIGDRYEQYISPFDFENSFKMNNGEILSNIEQKLTTKGGKEITILSSIIPVVHEGKKIIIESFISIDERKKTQKNQELISRILTILNRPNEWQLLIEDILTEIKNATGMDEVLIRLENDVEHQNSLPKIVSSTHTEAINTYCTFSELTSENRNNRIECICDKVVNKKRISTLQNFSKEGSFWTNNISNYIKDYYTLENGKRLKEGCNIMNYESVALIPIVSANSVMGLLQLNDTRKNRFTPEIITFFEEIAATLGIAFIRQLTEQKIKESELRFRSLYENATVGIYRTNIDGKLLMANPAIATMLGYTSIDELMEKVNVRENFIDINEREEFLRIILAEDVIYGYESKWRKKDNTQIIVRESSRVVRNNKNKIEYFEGIVEDITEKKYAEERFQMLAHAIQSVTECVTITDDKNNIIFINEAFIKTYGYSKEELIGKNINIVRVKEQNDVEMDTILEKTSLGGWRGEVINKKKNGTIFPVLLSSSVVKDEKGNPLALIGVAIDITDMKRSREELVNAKEKAEKSEKLKSEFLAQMSHEIRTPINSILSFSSLIKSEVEDKIDEMLLDGFNSIDSASKRVIRTIDLILNMSEIQTGTYEYSPKKIDLLEDVIIKLKHEFREMAKSRGLDLAITNKTDNTNLFADEYSVTQIFGNLIDNAIKYTTKGMVEIIVHRENEGCLTVDVSDTGIGISKEYLPNLFDAFTQEEQGYTRRYEGNGLGLAIVKKYCEFNNAQIEVKSKKNVGSTFRILFSN